jgi:dipeptidase E
MKRLLLASHGVGALRELVGDAPGLRVAFVPTAAGPDAEDEPWVQEDLRQLDVLGCEISTLDLARAGTAAVESALAGADAVFVTGGNAYLLLWHAQRSGFAGVVVPLVGSGRLVYAGTSAGAVLAGPNLDSAAAPHNRAVVPELESTRGLGLVGFTVLPHDQEPERAQRHGALVAAHPELEFVRLPDDRAVVVRGAEAEVVDSPLLS